SGGTSPQNNNNDGSHRLDTSPGSRQGSLDRDDSAVPIGRTWSEPANVNGTHPGFHVTPLRRGSSVGPTGRTHEWIDVRVVIGQPAGNRAPTASISTTNATPAVGQDTTLRATANDPDGDALAYRWTFGDDTWSTTSTPVIAKRWAVPGLYRVDCEVSDMRGGVTTASMWVDAGGTGRILPVSPGAVLDGLEYTAYEGWWTRLPDFARQRPLAEGVAAQARLAPRGRNDGFGTVYTGFLRVPADDVYTFTLTADDSALVRIAGRVVVDKQGTTSGDTFATGNLFLGAGLHPIEIQLAHRDGNESLRLEWNTLTMAKVEIPATAFARPSRVGDAAPVVTLQVPGGTMVARGGTASFTATATDADDAIVTVQYFWNRALIGEATAAPWTVAWPELWPGDKPVVAVARAADGRWAVSAPATVSVAAPPAARSIGINLVGDAGSGGVLSTDRVLGAQHRHGWWNNVSGSRTTVGSLRNGAGTVTAASVTTDFYNANGYVSAQAETADPDGAMLDGGLWTRDTGVAARVSVSGLPWSVSDVYVYVDASFGASQDTSLGAYTIGGTTRYIRNSLTTADQIGDWPVYDTWVGFREATATTTAAPVGQQLGNYLVFRNVAGSAITLDVQTQRPVNGVQIVEAGGTSGPINAAPTVTMPAEVAPATLVIP
ncbi:MAG: hypothetical protein RLZZ127_2097, partial [Planctomycetota bacterium]